MTTRDLTVSEEHFAALAAEHRRWGRWGVDDQRGALNLVTPQRVAAAAGLVRKGAVFSLAHPIGPNGPTVFMGGRFAPVHTFTRSGDDIRRFYAEGGSGISFTDDVIVMPLQSSTHWDALSHAFHDGRMYNDRGPEHVRSGGTEANSITEAADRMVGRGVLLDVPALTGRDHLDIGEAIEADDLQQCCERQGVTVGEGDFVLVRTGRLGLAARTGDWGPEWGTGINTGLGVSAAAWLLERDVTAVAADTFSVEIIPAQTSAFGEHAPVHALLLQGAGVHMGELWSLDELAADCAADGTYEFLLVAAPLLVDGAVGSACNPQALK
ncbi:cyclase family protein [Nocardioides sp. cx-173]|uniref:cyclase family protein n=1 Tax=Nocardioides sp. cx-173 TaxID=2898796 RepID=UPI001E39F8E2|nr:cyclase family protein [Nocardioides sp. cx-173]MCD4526603.1 cyclase family protein [Nocardioides sp. cx-173]UGB40698.1 cyclase family protein [Nocardioides sp. cx-173]